ncbi:MAG: formate/nitrite transporter family protein [Victivallaceae bacterium]|nr:formate/nitrite transporter family protein [Victivallaceae bacterium]
MKKRIVESFQTFVNAVFAGIFIGIAGTVYLAVPNPVAGAVLFGFGLMTILCFGFKLFTGAIGYLVNQKRKDFCPYLWTLFLIWCGNFAGTYAVGTAVRHSRTFSAIGARVTALCAAKSADGAVSLLILSFFCGILMYVAVESFRRQDVLEGIFRFFMVFLCVSIFILSGFEHCIADMFYFSAADAWCGRTLALTLLMTLGNALGGWLVPLGDKIRR